jgi:hypothetical protein
MAPTSPPKAREDWELVPKMDPRAGGVVLNLPSCIISKVAHTLSKQENHAQIKDP